MSTTPPFERELTSWMADEAAQGVPAGAIDAALAVTRRLRPRARWLSLLRETPMRTRSRVLVGSTTGRLAVVASTVLLLAIAAFAIGGGAGPNTPPPAASVSSPPGNVASHETAPPDAATPVPTAFATIGANCIQFETDGAYTASVGTLPVSVTVPGTPADPWRGDRDKFLLGKGPCGPFIGVWPVFHATLVGQVYADACHWATSSIDVPTAFAAAAALAEQTCYETNEPVETEIGAFRATRFDISVPSDFDHASCDDGGMKLWGDQPIVPGIPLRVYIAEVDGSTLGIVVRYDETTGPAGLQEIDSILASLRVDM